MRFIVYGAGAVGGVVGGRLHEHGHDTVLIARGAHLDAIRKNGLRLDWPDGSTTLPVPAVGHPSELDLGDGDVILLAMKGQDTAGAVDALLPIAPESLPVVCLQNGVANERDVLRRFPIVYGVAVMLPATHLEPGVVQASSAPKTGLLDIGRWPSGCDGTAEAIAAALASSTFQSVPRPDIARWKYRKLLMNLGNACEAAIGEAARTSDVLRRARDEGVACLEAAGIDVASEEEDRERRGDHLRLRRVGGERRGGGSSWQSLARGTGTIEADYLNGEIVLLGRLHGVATPVNAMLQRLAGELARSGAPPGSLTEDDLLARLS